MPFVRAAVFLLLIAALLCFATYIVTGRVKWRNVGVRILKWTVFAALAFFAVLLLERLPKLL